ncbi:GAF domain-containing protein, partial [Streptomyces scabiei]|uniref:GAF domain-containing protein n=1 Tax=Streptomyces scabiei TaxID=1930 RepID=UPI0029AAB0AC
MTGSGGRPGADDPLGESLAAAVRRTGARFGGVYVLDPEETTLGLIALCGVPVDAFASWWRAPYSVHGPSQDAVRNDRLVWVSSLEELARCYPRVAAGIPYQVAFAVHPLGGIRHRRGALLLGWAPGRSPRLSRRERGNIAFSARRVARVLDAQTLPPVVPDRPRFVRPHRDTPAPQSGRAAAEMVERLPLGTLALDLGGCVAYVNAAAADLLGRPAERLLGTQPWQSLTWLDDIAYMDAYRTAMSSREPVALTVVRPPGRRLDLRLHTDDDGTSVLISPHLASRPLGARPTPDLGSVSGAGPADTQNALTGTPSHSRIHLLMALAAALTDTLGVQDVVDLVAERILPAFGAHGMIMSTADAGRIQIIGHRGYDPAVIEQFDGMPTDADLTPAGRVLTTGASAFFADRGELSRFYPRAPQITDKHAWAFLPLLSSGHPIGCLLLAYNEPHPFTAGERSLLTPLAGLIAQALDRARLYDAKHNLAHALQQTLLPHALPTVAGRGAAGSAGG